jgi:hypothetical protein
MFVPELGEVAGCSESQPQSPERRRPLGTNGGRREERPSPIETQAKAEPPVNELVAETGGFFPGIEDNMS